MSITAMKQALEKIANVNAMDYEYQRWAKEALAIAEAEKQEPVGSISVRYYLGSKSMTNTDFDYNGDLPEGDYQLYTHPQPKAEQEPYGYLKLSNAKFYQEVEGVPNIEQSPDYLPLYTHPQPKREWVGLTDEERQEVVNKKWWDWEDAFDIESFARAIEAKLKEKNA